MSRLKSDMDTEQFREYVINKVLPTFKSAAEFARFCGISGTACHYYLRNIDNSSDKTEYTYTDSFAIGDALGYDLESVYENARGDYITEHTMYFELVNYIRIVGSANKAAKKLGVCQSSISNILNKLCTLGRTVPRALGYERVTLYRSRKNSHVA